jgi:hypothetical protein
LARNKSEDGKNNFMAVALIQIEAKRTGYKERVMVMEN